MKKTSIFFLVLSVILVGGGFFMRNKSVEKAEKKGIELFRQELTEKNDLVETVEFPADKTNKINVNLKNCDINIFGNADKSYVEIYNFNALEYSVYSNNKSFNLESDLISSITGRAEGGNIKFSGVRDYVRFDKHNKQRQVNIYISAEAEINIFNINLDKGNVYINDIQKVCDYTIKLEEGNVSYKNTPSVSLIDFEIQKGNVSLEKLSVKKSDITLQNGTLNFITPSNFIYDFDIESETGKIQYNNDTHQGKFFLINEEINGDFSAHIGVGNVIIKTFEDETQSTAETPSVDNQNNQPETTA